MSRYSKGIVAFVVSCALGAIAQGLIVGQTAAFVTVIVGALTTAGVVGASNSPKPPEGHVGGADAGLTILEVVIVLLIIVVFCLAVGWLPPNK